MRAHDHYSMLDGVPSSAGTLADETSESGHQEPATDDLGLGPGLGVELTDSIAESVVRGTEDFEHRLLVARVSMALFDSAPLRIGKYLVERPLGEGGMGRVYLCHDESLNRKVAIKLVRGVGSEVAQARLRREAVALARLSHDNVVQVYESGEHEGHTYVAMEYIEGRTLREWMREDHSRQVVLELFLAAGRGLAAAHAVGLVHRDFKPENVLIDSSGKPKVVDFGLVRDNELRPEYPGTSSLELGFERGLTAAGAVLGTRQYMPLEQIHSETADPRSDQFSFCMTLYEALWGEPAFPYTSFEARMEALEAVRPQAPPDRRDLYRVICRGLTRDPTDRWPDMKTLLRALEHASTRRRRWVRGSALGLGLGVALAVMPTLRPPPVDECAVVADQLDEVWNNGIAESLDRHLAALDAPHVTRSRELLREGLDLWAEAWIYERTAVCHALHAVAPDHGRLSEVSARDACLTRQKQEVATLVTELDHGDADTLARAVFAVSALALSASCDGTASLDPESLAPEVASRVEVLRIELARAHQLRLLGQQDRALDIAATLEAGVRALGYAPLLAQVVAERAKIEDEAGAPARADELYLEAIGLARKGRSETLEAELLLERAELSAFEIVNIDAATARYEWLATHVEADPPSPSLEAGVSIGRGRIAELAGDRQRAAELYQAAIETVGEEAPELPAYYHLLSRVVEPKAGLDASRRAHELAELMWGPEHPRTAERMRDYGIFLEERAGEATEGAELRARATAILASSGAVRDRAMAEFELARRAIGDRDWEAASEHARDLATLQDAFLPHEHPDRGEPEYLLASIEFERGRTQAAIEHAQAALRDFETDPALRAEPRVLALRNYLINVLMNEGKLDAARLQAQAVLQAADADSSQAVIAQLRLAEVAVRSDDAAKADALLEECGPRVAEIGEEWLTYELLRALVNLRLTPPQPVARDELDQVRDRYAVVDQRVPRWLEQLEVSDAEQSALGY